MYFENPKKPEVRERGEGREQPIEVNEAVAASHKNKSTSVKLTRGNETDFAANACILLFSAFATVVLCSLNMGTHRGATRSEVQVQESRRAALEQALAEQNAYLNEAVVELPETDSDKPDLEFMP